MTSPRDHHRRRRQHFTPLQSRALPRPLPSAGNLCALCPSMDLIAFGLGGRAGGGPTTTTTGGGDGADAGGAGGDRPAVIAAADGLYVHRTVSWQRLLAVSSSPELLPPSPSATPAAGGDASPSSPPTTPSGDADEGGGGGGIGGGGAATALCWSPDGRALAVGSTDGRVDLHAVEAASGSSSGLVAGGDAAGGGAGAPTAVHSVLVGVVPPVLASPSPGPVVDRGQEEVKEGGTVQPPRRIAAAAPSPVVTRSMAAARRRRREEEGGHGVLPAAASSTPARAGVDGPEVDDEAGAAAAAVAAAAGMREVVGLCWARRAVHPERGRRRRRRRFEDEDGNDEEEEDDDDEAEAEAAWTLRCRYLDRAHHFLPHAPRVFSTAAKDGRHHHHSHQTDGHRQYLSGSVGGGGGISNPQSAAAAAEASIADRNGTSGPPSARGAPLSVLCVASRSGHVSLFLHGRYLIGRIPPPPPPPLEHGGSGGEGPRRDFGGGGVAMVCSSDLSSVLFCPADAGAGSPTQLSLCSVPDLALRHHELRWVSASYAFVATQLSAAEAGLAAAASGWRDALRPLESKFSSLRRLLVDYGVGNDRGGGGGRVGGEGEGTVTVRDELLAFILVGSGDANRDGSAEAMAQFFGSLLNEQALQRIGKTVESGAASVESTLRSSVLGPAQALLYAASELCGQARSSVAAMDGRPALISRGAALRGHRAAEAICFVTEQCLAQMILCRHRLRDLLRWMSWELARVKASGTAVDSAERQSARNKRPAQVVLDRVASFLSVGGQFEDNASLNANQQLETEDILGVHLSSYFTNEHAYFIRNQLGLLDGIGSPNKDLHALKTPSVKATLYSTKALFTSLFLNPCEYISATIGRTDFTFSMDQDCERCNAPALHKRFGLLQDDSEGGFRPTVSNDLEGLYRSRQWFLAAKASSNIDPEFLQIVVVPDAPHVDDIQGTIARPQFYLTAFVMLPEGCIVQECFFYGDDGNSSLSVFGDSKYSVEPINYEARQALGLLVCLRSEQNDQDSCNVSEEIWMLQYDKLVFRAEEIEEGCSRVTFEGMKKGDATAQILFMTGEDGEEECDGFEEGQILFAKRRQLRTFEANKNYEDGNFPNVRRAVVSGSRGIGGVVTNNNNLALFDLEEDDEADDSDGGDDEADVEGEESETSL